MPYFDIDEAMRYAGDKFTADAEINLTGLTPVEAITRLEAEFSDCRDRCRSLIIRFEPAAPGKGESLFQPVGRFLLEKRRSGDISKLENLLEVGAGFYIEL